jgi:DNA-binding LytR/AlgR family response regulator
MLLCPLNQAAPVLHMHITNTGKISLPVTNLIYIQATGNYSWLHWNDGQRILMPRTLKFYESQLSASWFVRTHRKCLINLHYIERMQAYYPANRGGLIYLRSGAVLPVSRRRWVAIRSLYKQLPKATGYVSTAQA